MTCQSGRARELRERGDVRRPGLVSGAQSASLEPAPGLLPPLVVPLFPEGLAARAQARSPGHHEIETSQRCDGRRRQGQDDRENPDGGIRALDGVLHDIPLAGTAAKNLEQERYELGKVPHVLYYRRALSSMKLDGKRQVMGTAGRGALKWMTTAQLDATKGADVDC